MRPILRRSSKGKKKDKNRCCSLARRTGGVILFGSVLSLTFAALISRPLTHSPEACAITVYVSGDWFHANLTLPVRSHIFDWREHLNLDEIGQGNSKDYPYLSFGWGDRQFYLNTPSLQELNLLTTARAFLWPTQTVMHVQGHRSLPQADPHYRVEAIRLSEAGYRRLAAYTWAAFQKSPEGTPQRIRQSHRLNGTFYEGTGRYGLWQTCNDWLATGLHQANIRTPRWSGLAPSVFRQIQSNCVE